MKKVLVTGSSRGIGRAIAVALARAGYDPVIHCVHSLELANEVAEEVKALGASGDVLVFDIANRAECKATLEKYVAEKGAFYGIVLNAGIVDDSTFAAMDESQWDRVLKTDLDSFYNVLKPLVMPMILSHIRGRIVAVSSVAGLVGKGGQTNYSAAKAGLIGAVKALALELAPRGITVNAVAPGVIETEMTKGIFSEEAVNSIPMRRIGRSEDVAALVSFLLSEEASYITRQVISVDGGMC